MSLATYYLDYGRHVARLRRRCRRAYAPTSNTASLENHEKIPLWVSFSFPYEYGAPLGGPSGCRSSAIITIFMQLLSQLSAVFTYKQGARVNSALFWPGFVLFVCLFKQRNI